MATTTNDPHNNSSRHCGWCDRSPIGFQCHSNRTYPIWRQRKDDPNNASGSASGYRANTHTQTHTQAHTICVLPSLEEQRSRHMCLPELLLRKGSGSDSILVGENTVNSDFIKQHSHLLCTSHSVYFSILLLSLHPHFLLVVWPGGGSPCCRGFSRAPFQTNRLSQVLRARRVPNCAGTRHQRKPHYMEGRGAALW